MEPNADIENATDQYTTVDRHTNRGLWLRGTAGQRSTMHIVTGEHFLSCARANG